MKHDTMISASRQDVLWFSFASYFLQRHKLLFFPTDIVFVFSSTEFTFTEDSGTNLIPISLISGNPGDFTVILTGALDNVTATGKFADKKKENRHSAVIHLRLHLNMWLTLNIMLFLRCLN